MNHCGLCEIVHHHIYFFFWIHECFAFRTRGVQETVGQVTITSIDHFFCGEQRNWTFTTVVELISSKPQQTNICLLSFCDLDRVRTYNPRFRKPMLYPIELRNLFVIPERFELSTPGLKDRCSNHLSYEILFVILEGLEPSTFGVVNQRSIQLSYKIIFCNPRRAQTFNLRRIRPMLQPIELWDFHFGYLRGSNPVLRFHRPALYQIS